MPNPNLPDKPPGYNDPFLLSQWRGDPLKHPYLNNKFEAKTQRNPDFAQAKGTTQQWMASVDPETRRRQAMASARELGVGLTAEARANEARRGVSGTGVSGYHDRNIARTVMQEANKAGLEAADKGQELQLGGIDALTKIASGQSDSMQKDLDRALESYRLRQEQVMQQQQLRLQQMQTLIDAAKSGLGPMAQDNTQTEVRRAGAFGGTAMNRKGRGGGSWG